MPGGKLIGKTIHRFTEVSSTNDACRILADKDAPEGTVVISDIQTKGRGRLGRKWCSSDPAGLYMSVLIRPKFDQKHIPLIGLAAALSVAAAIKDLTGAKTSIKLPNDVLIGAKKVAGILMEQKGREVVLGIGVNLNNAPASFPEEIQETATSLLIETGKEVNKETFLSALLLRLDEEYGKIRLAKE